MRIFYDIFAISLTYQPSLRENVWISYQTPWFNMISFAIACIIQTAIWLLDPEASIFRKVIEYMNVEVSRHSKLILCQGGFWVFHIRCRRNTITFFVEYIFNMEQLERDEIRFADNILKSNIFFFYFGSIPKHTELILAQSIFAYMFHRATMISTYISTIKSLLQIPSHA